MSKMINTLSVGQEVWWEDPENKTSGAYKVQEIKYDSDGGLYDDTIILISNGVSESEVEAWELSDLSLRRQKIKELVDRVTDIVENDDWSIYNHDKNYDKVDLYLSKSSSRGQDFGFYVEYDSGDIDGFINAVEAYRDSYDPAEEAALWIGEDGHGRNGAPYDLADILEDMQECKDNVKGLIDLLNQELKGWKIPKPIMHFQYSERLYKIRTEVIGGIQTTLKDICNHFGSRSVLWSTITNDNDPDICYEANFDVRSVLPTTIGLDDDNDTGFIITFAAHEDCPNSVGGENIYTETLIDILEYLENYRSKL